MKRWTTGDVVMDPQGAAEKLERLQNQVESFKAVLAGEGVLISENERLLDEIIYWKNEYFDAVENYSSASFAKLCLAEAEEEWRLRST